jgi:hypothetical protein
VVNTCSVLLEASYEIPERDLLIVVVCHVYVYVCDDCSMCLCLCLCGRVYFSCGKIKVCELQRKEGGTGHEIYTKPHQSPKGNFAA